MPRTLAARRAPRARRAEAAPPDAKLAPCFASGARASHRRAPAPGALLPCGPYAFSLNVMRRRRGDTERTPWTNPGRPTCDAATRR
ncbi:type III secretion inner membrane SctV domain protein [Burkholderia pseudomallei]|nr:type III secretion inner membrane SctV domain protein [Burkholderia pseudomallei]